MVVTLGRRIRCDLPLDSPKTPTDKRVAEGRNPLALSKKEYKNALACTRPPDLAE
jgi:hypothetical protein